MALDIKFGVSTWLWTSPFGTTLAEPLFAKISSMGYDAVEIAVEDPALIESAKIRELLNRYSLEVIVCGAFGPSRDLTADDRSLRENGLHYIEECLDICVGLGARFFAGPMYAAVGKARMVSPGQRTKEWELAVSNLQKVCRMAEARGLEIALEPLNRFESDLVNTAADAARLIADIDHPAAKMILDGFHMNIEEPSIQNAISAAGKHLIHVQVAENYRGTPGTGQTNWRAWYQGLEAIGYTGTVSIESFTPDNQELAAAVCVWKPLARSQDQFAREGLAFLKQWASGIIPEMNTD
ncbi:sugar phosphate isomerase/epimerase family protein [Anseongella ginsenosidimutans]|nr:sugar phosphate isomerase/epimerase family protein [Anseongella ginsenosidimutans]QEC51261.1 sugar phosphate isomerase/epimerase [Anseongella ginsenosidimutans]